MKKPERKLNRNSVKIKDADFDTDKYLAQLRKKIVVEHEPHKAPKPRKLFAILIVSAMLLLAAVMLAINPSFIGFVTQEKEVAYNDTIGMEFVSNSEYEWETNNPGILKGIRLYGQYLNGTRAKVYIENEGSKYLILDLEKLGPEEISSITGFAVKDEEEKNKTKDEKDKEKDKGNETKINETIPENATIPVNVTPIVNETINQTIPVNETINETLPIPTNETPIANITIPVNETINITPIINGTINKSISIKLEYNKNSPYDDNDDGVESLNNVIDFTVDSTSFNWGYGSSSLCTRWEVYSIEDSKLTTTCYGSGACCGQLGLLPERDNWNDELYLSYNSLGATYNNVVSARIIYHNESEIVLSQWANLSARFKDLGLINYNNVCEETCSVSGFNKSGYKLVIEVENGKLILDKISYTLLQKFGNNAPQLVKNISNIAVKQGKNATINLSQYFADADNDALQFSYYKPDNLTIMFDNGIAAIIPDRSFNGILYTFMAANDSEDIGISNVFAINVSKGEYTEQDRAEINKPVKWLKSIIKEKSGDI